MIIGDDVWIGDNAVIVGPISIGRGAIVGANSVVRHDVPGRTIAAGVPARLIKQFNSETCRWERTSVSAPQHDPAITDEQFRESRA